MSTSQTPNFARIFESDAHQLRVQARARSAPLNEMLNQLAAFAEMTGPLLENLDDRLQGATSSDLETVAEMLSDLAILITWQARVVWAQASVQRFDE